MLTASALGLVLLAGCGTDDEEAATAAAPPPAPATAEPAPTTTTSPPADDGPVRASGDQPRTEVLVSGLEIPWDVAFLPDGRALATEREGSIRLIGAGGELRDEPAATVEVQAEGEGGLMGLATDPEFGDERPFVYAMATRDGEVQVLRLRWDGRALTEEATVLDGIVAGPIHDSGRLRFGPDDRLYVVTGDAGDGDVAQQRDSRNGKVLALDPADYRGTGPGEPTMISIGHRNPQGLDWEPETDRLFVTEHGPSGSDGPSCCDEVNLVREGGNYAWPQFGDEQPDSARPAQLWQDTIAPSGMAFVTQPDSAWTGDVLVAALRGTSLRRLELGSDGRATDEEVLLDGEYGRLRAVVEAPDGALWVTTSNRDGRGSPADADDRILRIVPPAA